MEASFTIRLTVVCVADVELVNDKRREGVLGNILYSGRVITPIQSDQHLVIGTEHLGKVPQETSSFISVEVACPFLSVSICA